MSTFRRLVLAAAASAGLIAATAGTAEAAVRLANPAHPVR